MPRSRDSSPAGGEVRARGAAEDHAEPGAGEADHLGQGIAVEPLDVDQQSPEGAVPDAHPAADDLGPDEEGGGDPHGGVPLGLAGDGHVP